MQVEQLREKLVHFILSGNLEPGSRLKEVALARRLGVSRTPLREALIGLEKEGLIIARPNAGYSVKLLTRIEASELYPIVWALEELALKECFDKARTYVPALREINRDFSRASKSAPRARDLDLKFHRELIRGCTNTILQETLGTLKQRLSRYEVRYMEEPELVKTSTAQHDAILDALTKNNKHGAAEALIENWKFGMNALLARIPTN